MCVCTTSKLIHIHPSTTKAKECCGGPSPKKRDLGESCVAFSMSVTPNRAAVTIYN